MQKAIIAGLVSLFSATLLQAYSPELGTILPRGGQRGKDVKINLYGKRMIEPQELIFYKPGIVVKSLTKVKDTHVKAVLTIAPDAPLGEHPVRLRCKGGVTYMRTFWIGQFPSVKEVEPNNDYAKPQVVGFNSTVHGAAGIEDADYYQVSAKKGQRISAEVEGMRLGAVFFDPYIAILDSRRFEMATSDDAPLLKQDAFVSVVAPEDGNYTVLVRESAYEGSKNCRYRLHIGGFTRPAAVYPPGANPGVAATFKMIGDPAGDYDIQATPVGKEGTAHGLFAHRDGQSAPSPNPVIVSALPFANEKEPNNESKKSTPEAPLNAPCAFHGIISKTGDVDWFKFHAKKGQNLRLRVRGRSLRSPLDSVLILRDAKGKQLGRNDDQGSLDSILDFKPAADGDYFVNVRDHLGKGGPGYTYRVEIDHRRAALTATLPEGKRNDSQYRKVICIPRGNRYATVVNVARANIGCDCKLQADSLPQGVNMKHSPIPKSATNFLALFEAAPDAPVAGGLHHLTILDAKPDGTDGKTRGDLKEIIHHIEINNTGVFHSTFDDRITIAVIEEAPFHVDLYVPPVPIVKNGTAQLKVTLRRSPGFDGVVKVTLPWKPPGIGSPTDITIPKGKNEAVYSINASNDAAVGNHQICVVAESTTKKGLVVISSALANLAVSEPLVALSMEMASTIPGENTALLCKVTHNQPIQGKAQIILHGLPHGVKTTPKEIDANTKEVIFELAVAADATKGKHNALFCQILPKRDGHIMAHNTGHGGTLRINPPPPAPKVAKVAPKTPKPAATPATPATKKPATTPPAKPKKPLSRLEQLRQRKK